MRRRLIFFLLFLSFFSSLWAEKITLTLEEALVIALRDNPQILLAENELKKAKLKIKEAKEEFFPNLSASLSIFRTQEFYPQDINQQSLNLNLRQPLYTSGRIINTIKLNQEGFKVVEAILDKTKQEIIFNTTKAFFSLLLAEELSKLNKEILDNLNEHLNTLTLRFEKGEASELEIEKLKTARKEAEEEYLNSLNQIQAYKSVLKNLLSLEQDVDLEIEGNFSYEPQELAYDEAFVLALSKRPEFSQYEAQIRQQELKAKLIQSQSKPNIYAFWDYYSKSHTQGLTGLNKAPNDYNVLGLVVSWPFFDGFKTSTQLKQVLLDIESTKLAKEKLKEDIALELKTAYLKLKTALNKIKTQEKEFSFYEKNLESVREKYIQGLLSHLDLKDAELKKRISLFNKKQAIYEYILAKLSFKKAYGGL